MEQKHAKWIQLIILALIWGSSFILMKRGLLGLNPLQLGSLRIIFAGLFLLVIGFKNLPKIPQGKWKFLALTAFCGTFMPVYLFALAQTEIDSSVSAVLNATTPLATLILGAAAFGLTFNRAQIIGVVVGLGGTLLLILNGAMNHPEQNYYYALLVVIASIGYALNVNFIKRYLSDMHPLTICTGNFLTLLVPATIVLYISGFFQVADQEVVQTSVVYIVILGIVGTGMANLIFFKLIQTTSPVFATSVTYLIPVVAFFWGMLDGELFTPTQFVGAFIILIGVYLAGKK